MLFRQFCWSLKLKDSMILMHIVNTFQMAYCNANEFNWLANLPRLKLVINDVWEAFWMIIRWHWFVFFSFWMYSGVTLSENAKFLTGHWFLVDSFILWTISESRGMILYCLLSTFVVVSETWYYRNYFWLIRYLHQIPRKIIHLTH